MSLGDLPIRRAIFTMGGLLQRALNEDLSITPPHHPQIDRLSAVFLDVLIHAQFPQDPRGIGGDLDAFMSHQLRLPLNVEEFLYFISRQGGQKHVCGGLGSGKEKQGTYRQTKVQLLIPRRYLNETDRHLPAPIYKMDGALSTIVT